MNVLLSVKPKYADEIVADRKKYEFRKSIFKRKNIEKIFIYSSFPVKKIIAVIEIVNILSDSPQRIWELCNEYAGISKKDFFKYFRNSDIAFAIEIEEVEVFEKPLDPFSKFENFQPPQSFYYFNKNVKRYYDRWRSNFKDFSEKWVLLQAVWSGIVWFTQISDLIELRYLFTLLRHRGNGRTFIIVSSENHQVTLFERARGFMKRPWSQHYELITTDELKVK